MSLSKAHHSQGMVCMLCSQKLNWTKSWLLLGWMPHVSGSGWLLQNQKRKWNFYICFRHTSQSCSFTIFWSHMTLIIKELPVMLNLSNRKICMAVKNRHVTLQIFILTSSVAPHVPCYRVFAWQARNVHWYSMWYDLQNEGVYSMCSFAYDWPRKQFGY